MLEEVAPQVLRSIFKLKNIRRAEGVAGQLVGAAIETLGTDTPFYLDTRGLVSSWPGSMTVVVSFLWVYMLNRVADLFCFSMIHDHLPTIVLRLHMLEVA